MEIDWEDLESIIENYYQALYRYCYKMLRNKEDAEDMVKETDVNMPDMTKIFCEIMLKDKDCEELKQIRKILVDWRNK